MRLLKSEYEYREWFEQDFIQLNNGYEASLNPDEIESEILRLMPEDFPCIVWELKETHIQNNDNVFFITKSKIKEWAMILDNSIK